MLISNETIYHHETIIYREKLTQVAETKVMPFVFYLSRRESIEYIVEAKSRPSPRLLAAIDRNVHVCVCVCIKNGRGFMTLRRR